jgi:ankyrin repeat protein
MSKQNHNISNQQPSFMLMNNFFYYISKKYNINYDQAIDLAEKEDIRLEYLYKLRFMKKINKVQDETMSGAIINLIANSSLGLNHAVYDNFMHYVACNDIKPSIIESYVNQWAASGRNLEETDYRGRTPLEIALVFGKIDCIAEFAKDGCIDLTELTNGESPLHILVKLVDMAVNEPEAITTWCKLGLPTNTVSSQGFTPLHYAVSMGIEEVVFAFAEAGVGLSTLDNGISILDYCALYKRSDIVEKLIDKYKDFIISPTIDQNLTEDATNLPVVKDESVIEAAPEYPETYVKTEISLSGNHSSESDNHDDI